MNKQIKTIFFNRFSALRKKALTELGDDLYGYALYTLEKLDEDINLLYLLENNNIIQLTQQDDTNLEIIISDLQKLKELCK